MSEGIIKVNVRLPYKVNEENNWFIACCFPLDIHAQGRTEKEAVKQLKEAVELFLTSCVEMGTLEKVLKECGITLAKQKKPLSFQKQPTISIPLNLITENYRECHA